jgi:hypothetical protein
MTFEAALRKAGSLLRMDRQGTLNFFYIGAEQAELLSKDPNWKWVVVSSIDPSTYHCPKIIGRKKRGWKRSEVGGLRDNAVLRLEDL